ncbi:MAG: hypothetical protein HOQ35_03005 [Acidobacteriaceae bacterium]|nr:hypothetical protein [Acidobacteriaceae bacterium]
MSENAQNLAAQNPSHETKTHEDARRTTTYQGDVAEDACSNLSEKISFNRSTTVNFHNNTSLTLDLTGASCQGDSILHNVPPPNVIQPGQQVQWIQKVSSLEWYSSYASYSFPGGSLTVKWTNPISSGNTYTMSWDPTPDYNMTYTGGKGTEATVDVYFVANEKLDITFYNQSDLSLTLDPASLLIQDGEFTTQPPASIVAGGQANWTMVDGDNTGKGIKGSCIYQFQAANAEPGAATLSWDPSNSMLSTNQSSGGYGGEATGSYPSLSFYFHSPLQAILYNQTNATLTLDPASVQNQDGEFVSQPPASIAPQGQGTWNVAGTKGSCTYQYDDGSGNSGSAELWWDKSYPACQINISGQGGYRGSNDNYPSLNFYFQPHLPHANTGSHGQ